MSTFGRSLQICGLSQQGAADFFDVRLDTVKSWSSGRRQPPAGVWKMLAALYKSVEEHGEHAAHVLELDGIPAIVYSSLAADFGGDDLPSEGPREVAGAMGLLIAISELEQSH